MKKLLLLFISFMLLCFYSVYAVDDKVTFAEWDRATPFKVVDHDPGDDGTLDDITVEEYLKAVLYGELESYSVLPDAEVWFRQAFIAQAIAASTLSCLNCRV